MAFCPNCGYQLTQNMRFCPGCGQDITSFSTPAVATRTNIVTGDYRVALVNMGSCRLEPASDILEDMFGYTDAQAKALLRSAPVEIAQNLNATQAQYIAQALTEYGLQVSVYTDRGYVNFNNHFNTSVFDAAGNYCSGLAEALALFTVANRVAQPTPWRGFGSGGIFSLIFGRPTPPPHHRRPAPRPVPHPAPHTPVRPAPPRGPAPMPGGPMGVGRGPSIGQGPMGGPGPMPGPGGRGPGGRGPGGRGW